MDGPAQHSRTAAPSAAGLGPAAGDDFESGRAYRDVIRPEAFQPPPPPTDDEDEAGFAEQLDEHIADVREREQAWESARRGHARVAATALALALMTLATAGAVSAAGVVDLATRPLAVALSGVGILAIAITSGLSLGRGDAHTRAMLHASAAVVAVMLLANVLVAVAAALPELLAASPATTTDTADADSGIAIEYISLSDDPGEASSSTATRGLTFAGVVAAAGWTWPGLLAIGWLLWRWRRFFIRDATREPGAARKPATREPGDDPWLAPLFVRDREPWPPPDRWRRRERRAQRVIAVCDAHLDARERARAGRFRLRRLAVVVSVLAPIIAIASGVWLAIHEVAGSVGDGSTRRAGVLLVLGVIGCALAVAGTIAVWAGSATLLRWVSRPRLHGLARRIQATPPLRLGLAAFVGSLAAWEARLALTGAWGVEWALLAGLGVVVVLVGAAVVGQGRIQDLARPRPVPRNMMLAMATRDSRLRDRALERMRRLTGVSHPAFDASLEGLAAWQTWLDEIDRRADLADLEWPLPKTDRATDAILTGDEPEMSMADTVADAHSAYGLPSPPAAPATPLAGVR